METPTEPRKLSGLGVAGVVIGALSLLVCWLPILGGVAMLSGVVGLGLSVAGIVSARSTRRTGLGWPIAGAAMNATAMAASAVLTLVIVGAIRRAADEAKDRPVPVQVIDGKPVANPGPYQYETGEPAKP